MIQTRLSTSFKSHLIIWLFKAEVFITDYVTYPEVSEEKSEDLRKEPGLRHPEGSLRSAEVSPLKEPIGDREEARSKDGKSPNPSEELPRSTEESAEEVEDVLDRTAMEL